MTDRHDAAPRSAPEYKRLGHLVAEREEHHDEQGGLVGAGMFAAELYACDTCHAVVWYGSIPDHTAWHTALAVAE